MVFIKSLIAIRRKFGIKVEEFGIGFPPRAFGRKIGETIYSINWLPIGGFVKLYGEDQAGGGKVQVSGSRVQGDKEDIDRAFFARPLWQRMTARTIFQSPLTNITGRYSSI